MTQPITSPIQLFDQGQTVADLHQSLVFLSFEIADREVTDQRFGRTTRQAVFTFQQQNTLDPSGQVDRETAIQLNRALTTAGYFPVKARPFQDRQILRLKLRDTSQLDDSARTFVQERLNTQLTEAILQQFREPSEALQTAVRQLDLDYETLSDETISSLFAQQIFPVLLDDSELEAEIEQQADQGFAPSNTKVADLLDLEQDLRHHPAFVAEVRRGKNQAIGQIVGLDTVQIEAIEDLELEATENSSLTRLVDEGVMTVEQREDLENAIAFSNMTDDSFELIEVLRADNRRTPLDLITLDKSDWVTLLEDHSIEPPEEDDIETYARLINKNIQQTFRTPYLMHRLVERPQADTLQQTEVIQPLLAQNEQLFLNGRINPNLDWSGINDQERATLETSLTNLNRYANTYRHLGIVDILNDHALNPQAKQQAINTKQQALQQFHTNNPDFDLDWANFFNVDSEVGQAFQVNWDEIDSETQPQVRKTMMAFQRVHQLTDLSDEAGALLAQGLDSAWAISNLSEKEFIKRVDLPETIAKGIYRRAGDTAIISGHFIGLLEESTTHAQYLPGVLAGTEIPNLEVINVLKEIDGYEDLFGSQNYCNCKSCRSIFSPAAYFVDLMDFVHKNVSEPNFIEADKANHPLYLKNRRADLWALPLTCANTDTLIPYLTIVNEVLERYLEMVFETDDIYADLTEAGLSFHQPFNLPFAELQLYLKHFGSALVNIYELFSLSENNIARIRLGCSPEEFSTIVTPDNNDIEFRYGNPDNLQTLEVPALIQAMGITRPEFDQLLNLDFIVGGLEMHVRATSPNDDLIGFVETLTFSFIGQMPDNLAPTDTLITHCLDRLHRFVRLWHKLPWSPEELHLVWSTLIDASGLSGLDTSSPEYSENLGVTLNEALVLNIAQLRFIQETFELPVEQLIALYDEIPTTPLSQEKSSLFTRLFGDIATLTIHHPELDIPGSDGSISNGFAQLQGALRLSESQVLTLLSLVLPPEVIQGGVLESAHLSQLYRHAQLAHLLDINAEELQYVKTLLGVDLEVDQAADRIPQLLELIRFKQALAITPYSITDVQWILSDEVSSNLTFRVTQEHIEQLLETLRNDQNRFFTPQSFTEEMDWLTSADAEQLLVILAAEPLELVTQPDTNVQQYVLTPYDVSRDWQPIIDFFTGPPNEEMPEVAAEKAEAIATFLNLHNPIHLLITHLSEQFVEQFNFNQAYFESLFSLVSASLTQQAFLEPLIDWLAVENPDAESTQSLIDLILESDSLIKTLERLIYLFTEKLNLPTESLSLMGAYPEIFALTSQNKLSWHSLELLSIYKRFLPELPEEVDSWHQLLQNWTGVTFLEDDRSQVATLLQTDLAQLNSLLENLVLPTQALDALQTLSSTLKLSGKLGLNGAALKQLTASDYEGLVAASNLVYGAIRAKYDEQTWAEIVEPYQDHLNMIKRDALVDRILSKEFQLKFSDPRELYQFFLLDVEMDGCARISRVKEAISACQLYVHRCRMNLEQSESGDIHVFPEDIPGDEWEWRQNYRVWEANRKVFLYPENWLEPDLRDNKTPIFKQLESDLLQNAVTPESVESAYRKYLQEFAEVSKLIIVCAHYIKEEKAFLFFARTSQDPYQYYWRKLIDLAEWTPWVKIELSIPSDRVSAIVHHQKIYLFWLESAIDKNATSEAELRAILGSSLDTFDDEGGLISGNPIPIKIGYSFLMESGNWSQVQNLPFYSFKLNGSIANAYEILDSSDFYNKIYLESKDEIEVTHNFKDLGFHAGHAYASYFVKGKLNEFKNRIENNHDEVSTLVDSGLGTALPFQGSSGPFVKRLVLANNLSNQNAVLGFPNSGTTPLYPPLHLKDIEDQISNRIGTPENTITNVFNASPDHRLEVIHYGSSGSQAALSQSYLLQLFQQQFLIYSTGKSGYPKDLNSILEIIIAAENSRRKALRLTTTISDRLGEILFRDGLDKFLSQETQEAELVEDSFGFLFTWHGELTPQYDSYNDTVPGNANPIVFQGAYGVYFRELFFDIPFLIANYLNSIQKFDQADYWYRKIFDPTASENPEPSNPIDRNWRYIEFRNQDVPKLRSILTDESAIARYKENPFNPFAIARLRISAFQKAIVMKYIDNLLDWGDHLFSQDTFESINEATMLYIMAVDILGDRPVQSGNCKTAREDSLTYQEISWFKKTDSEFLIELENFSIVVPIYVEWERTLPSDWQVVSEDLTSNANVESHSLGQGFPLLRNSAQPNFISYENLKVAEKERDNGKTATSRFKDSATNISVSTAQQRSLVFCVPPNEKLLGYWERVEDRLYKIRHCMNVQGVRRQLALFQPPIDPGLLVRAKAAGLSLEDVLALLNADLSPYRFTHLIQQAKQFTNTVQSFGNSLLNILEKKDAEELTLLRVVHEQNLLEFIRRVKEENKHEAEALKESLEATAIVINARKDYYANLITDLEDENLETNKSEKDSIEKLGESKRYHEKAANREIAASVLNGTATVGYTLNVVAQVGKPLAAYASNAFNFNYGTSNIAAAIIASANYFRRQASTKSVEATLGSTKSGYERRNAEWEHQKNLADKELEQLDQQLIAADIRIAIAEKDLESHHKQVQQTQEIYDFYKGKFTNVGLYTYLSTSLSRLYREAYNMAYELAQKAQRAYQFEIDDNTFFVTNDNWPADKAGLLAGERLLLQLQRIEQAYLEQNKREFELTKHVSLALLDPLALVQLRETGRCFINLPEESFDLDYPGHYFRRIKSVSITLPCVVGPYTTIPCTLRLLKNSIRINTSMPNGSYPHNTDEQGLPATDDRFVENNIPVKAIATSNAQNDSGVFELSFRDERYLPFEGAGAVSQWSLELFHDLPNNNPDFGKPLRQFDYNTITDAILHIKYTAREDAGSFKNGAISHLREYFSQDGATPSLRMFNLRQEFPSQWQRFLHPTDPANGNVFDLSISANLFPAKDQGKTLKINHVWFLACCKNADNYEVVMAPPLPAPPPTDANTLTLATVTQYGGLHFGEKDVSALAIELALRTHSPVSWQFTMTRAGGANLEESDVEDVLLVFGYEWEDI